VDDDRVGEPLVRARRRHSAADAAEHRHEGHPISPSDDILALSLANSLTFNPAGTYNLWLYGSAGANRRLDVEISRDGGSTWLGVRAGMILPSSGPGWYEVPLYAPATGERSGRPVSSTSSGRRSPSRLTRPTISS